MYSKIREKLAVIVTALVLSVACYGQNPAATASRPAIDPRVDRILTRLEGREVHDLHAKVSWKLRYIIDEEDEAVTKQGELWYQQQDPVAKFLVHFSKKISANRLHKLDERHLFDGRWYVKLDSETKSVTRQEIRRESDRANPYKLGEGPFPVPFGQKKAAILDEFDVTLVAPAEGDPPDTDHLKLTPREDSETGQSYKYVDVWVLREGPLNGLPIKVNAGKRAGTGQLNSIITIAFEDIQLNQGFSGSIFEIKTPHGYDEPPPERLDPIAPPPEAATP